MTRTTWTPWLCAWLVVACGDSLAPPSSVTDLRVVGARVELRSDPERANPSPGDAIEVTQLVIDRGAPPSDLPEAPALTPSLLQWDLVACVPVPTTIGPPICLTPIAPCDGCQATPPDDLLATPVTSFTTPSQDELDAAGASSMLLQGAVCGNGVPSREAILRFLSGETEDLVPCEGPPTIPGVPIEGRFVTVQIPIETEPSDPNLNPVLANVLYGGASWPPPYDQGVPRTAPRTGCAEDLDGLTPEQRAAHPRAGTMSSAIELYVTPDSLQTYTVDGVEQTEQIQVSWLADGGSFETSFSFIVEPATSILIQWAPGTGVPDDGLLARFTFVIRDGRGGTDWVERGLCILPAEPDESPP